MANIEAGGTINVAKAGAYAKYGEGLYAWPEAHPGGPNMRYIDIQVPPETAVETIIDERGMTMERLVPPEGNTINVKIVGHNFTATEVSAGQKIASGQ